MQAAAQQSGAQDSRSFATVLFYRLWIPFATTTAGQVFAGAFLGVKADMQQNPALSLRLAFVNRYRMDNPTGRVIKGVSNIYKGNYWNYIYTMLCSLTGNNLVQFVKS